MLMRDDGNNIDDRCKLVTGTSKEGVESFCGRRTAYVCDRCQKRICHEHFVTFWKEREICDMCCEIEVAEAQKRIEKDDSTMKERREEPISNQTLSGESSPIQGE